MLPADRSIVLFLHVVDAQAQYMPANLANTLQEIHEAIRGLDNNVRVGRAETANVAVRLRNRRPGVTVADLRPLQKTVCRQWCQFSLIFAHPFVSCQVPGSGLQLARALAPDHVSLNAIDQFAANNPEFVGADIGSTPPHFNPSIFEYEHGASEHLNVLKLVLFYNEDFGIVAESELSHRMNALLSWLYIIM